MTLRRTQPRAYTLLELVLVLAIIAATLAMVAPSLSGFARGRRPEEAARKFVSLTRLGAQSGGDRRRLPTSLLLTPSQGQWKLNVQDDTGTFIGTPVRSVRHSAPLKVWRSNAICRRRRPAGNHLRRHWTM